MDKETFNAIAYWFNDKIQDLIIDYVDQFVPGELQNDPEYIDKVYEAAVAGAKQLIQEE